MGGSKVIEVQLVLLSVVGEVGRVGIALHDAHLEDLAECQLHKQSTDLVSDALGYVILLETTDSYSFEELGG